MHKLSNKGFTLIELVIGMLVFGILGTAVTMVFVNGVNFTRDEQSQTLNQLRLTDFSVRLESDVRKSTHASVAGGCLVLAQTTNVQYCHDPQTQAVLRNGAMLADKIASFTVSVNQNQIHILITTLQDKRNVANTLALSYYLRQGQY